LPVFDGEAHRGRGPHRSHSAQLLGLNPHRFRSVKGPERKKRPCEPLPPPWFGSARLLIFALNGTELRPFTLPRRRCSPRESLSPAHRARPSP
jgi:hypothetical protein